MIGKILHDRYKIIKLIGSGGMADVYLAYCNQLDRKVALKVLKSSDDDLAKEVFMRESKAIARLSHPNIVQVYDFFEEDNKQCIVMEYIQGESLKTILRSGEREFSEKQVLEMGLKLSKALSHAHSNGVIHSDIKPDNIIVDEYFEPRITDFGIAKLISDGSTGTKQMYGSARYSSPEQVQGKIIDERSDIYSLGVVLYELINKKLPYPSDTEEVIDFKLSKLPIVNPKNINPTISRDVNNLLMRCLSSDKNDRYGSMRYVTTEIGEILYGYGEKKASNKKKKIIMISVAAILSVIALITIIVMSFGSSDVKVPNIELMSYSEANEKIVAEGLYLKIIERKNSTNIKKDIIISQEHKGEMVKKGTTINVVVSSGEDDVLVPDLSGLSLEEAKEELAKINVQLGEVKTVETQDVEINHIVSQEPSAGFKVEKDTVVKLLVSGESKSKEKILMPNLRDSYVEEAISRLNNLGLYVDDIEFEESREIEKDKIISTSIEPNTEVKPNDSVTLIVSNGDTIKDGEYIEKSIPINISSYVDDSVRIRVDYAYGSNNETVYSEDVNTEEGIVYVLVSAPKGSLYTVFIDQDKVEQGVVE